MSQAAPLPIPAKPRSRSIEARRAKRVEKAHRERRIVDLLNDGVSVAEIAAREGVTEKRMRAVVREILGRRMPQAPADYAALQASRLDEALLVAMSAMSGTDLRAVECVVKILREMDRYHGFSPTSGAPRARGGNGKLEGGARRGPGRSLFSGRTRQGRCAIEGRVAAPCAASGSGCAYAVADLDPKYARNSPSI